MKNRHIANIKQSSFLWKLVSDTEECVSPRIIRKHHDTIFYSSSHFYETKQVINIYFGLLPAIVLPCNNKYTSSGQRYILRAQIVVPWLLFLAVSMTMECYLIWRSLIHSCVEAHLSLHGSNIASCVDIASSYTESESQKH